MGRDTGLLCLLARADRRGAGGEDADRHLRRLEAIIGRTMALMRSEGERVISPRPLLTGDDVMSILGLRPGPRIGEILRWLTTLQVEGRVTTRAEAEALVRSLPPSWSPPPEEP
jgi:poly(A) polymerase